MLKDDGISSIFDQAPEPPRMLDASVIRATAADVTQNGSVTRRRSLMLIAASVAIVIAVAAVTATIAHTTGFQHGVAPAGSGTRPSPPTSVATNVRPTPNKAELTTAPTNVCRGDELRASSFRRGSVASAPFIVVKFTLVGSVPCFITGRPAVEVIWKKHVAISLHAGTYEVPDTPASKIVLEANTSAYVTIGTSTASEGTNEVTYNITRLKFRFTQQKGATVLNLADALGAITRAGTPIAIGVTSATPVAQ